MQTSLLIKKIFSYQFRVKFLNSWLIEIFSLKILDLFEFWFLWTNITFIGDNNVCQYNEKFSFSNTGKSSIQNPLANSNFWGYQKKIKSRTLDDALSNAIFKNNDILLKIDV